MNSLERWHFLEISCNLRHAKFHYVFPRDAICLCLEPRQSHPHSKPNVLKIHLNIILYLRPRTSNTNDNL